MQLIYNVTKIVLILLGLFANCSHLSSVNVVFRYDDPTIQFDSINNRVITLFLEKSIPLSIAVIPCDTNENPFLVTDSIYLQKLTNPLIEICLHGLTHQVINNQGEFGSLTFQETQRRIRKGKDILQSYFETPISTFIPPFNAINDDLPSILKQEGLAILASDCFDHIVTNDVLYYPETLGHLMKTDGIWNAANTCIFNNSQKDNLCIVMFHSYDIQDEHSWSQLTTLLDECARDSNVHLYTFSGLMNHNVDGSAKRYNSHKLESFLKKHVVAKGLLHPTTFNYGIHLLNAILYAFPFIISLCVSLLFLVKRKRILYVSVGVIICGCIITLAWTHLIGPNKLWLISFSISIIFFLIPFFCKHISKYHLHFIE